MQAENTSSELHEGLPIRNKYTNNKAKQFNINTINKQLLGLASVTTYSEKIYGLWVPVG